LREAWPLEVHESANVYAGFSVVEEILSCGDRA